MRSKSYRWALIDNYSDTQTREFSIRDHLHIFCHGNQSGRLELVVETNTATGVGNHYPKRMMAIPGPHICNLAVLHNPVWIFLCMTMGYFRGGNGRQHGSAEKTLATEAQRHLARNKKFAKERREDAGYV